MDQRTMREVLHRVWLVAGLCCIAAAADAQCLLPRPTPSGPALWIPDQGTCPVPSSIEVRLATGGAQIAGTQGDITFPAGAGIDARVNGRPDCSVNPDINKGATSFAFRPSGCTGGDCIGVRALVLATDNTDPIADGVVLFTCNIYTLVTDTITFALSGVILSDPTGRRVADVGNRDGMICFVENCCFEVPGSVGFDDLQVLPAKPVVGDTVELRFNVSYAVYSVDNVEVRGTAPLLEAIDSDGRTTFHFKAVQAGTTSLQLDVTYGTEELCGPYYHEGPSHTVSSPSYTLEIGDAPAFTPTLTPTPTATATPSPTQTLTAVATPTPTSTPTASVSPVVTQSPSPTAAVSPRRVADEGCQLDQSAGGQGRGGLVLLAAALFSRRWRRRPATNSARARSAGTTPLHTRA